MHQCQTLQRADARESIAGEEDPGAALDTVRAMLERANACALALAQPTIHMECREGAAHIGVEVGWQHCGTGNAAELLGLVVAHHGQIADTAWRACASTGARSVELEIDERADGVFYVNRKDCPGACGRVTPAGC